jgi:hypothetical protein
MEFPTAQRPCAASEKPFDASEASFLHGVSIISPGPSG